MLSLVGYQLTNVQEISCKDYGVKKDARLVIVMRMINGKPIKIVEAMNGQATTNVLEV